MAAMDRFANLGQAPLSRIKTSEVEKVFPKALAEGFDPGARCRPLVHHLSYKSPTNHRAFSSLSPHVDKDG